MSLSEEGKPYAAHGRSGWSVNGVFLLCRRKLLNCADASGKNSKTSSSINHRVSFEDKSSLYGEDSLLKNGYATGPRRSSVLGGELFSKSLLAAEHPRKYHSTPFAARTQNPDEVEVLHFSERSALGNDISESGGVSLSPRGIGEGSLLGGGQSERGPSSKLNLAASREQSKPCLAKSPPGDEGRSATPDLDFDIDELDDMLISSVVELPSVGSCQPVREDHPAKGDGRLSSPAFSRPNCFKPTKSGAGKWC